MMEMKKKKFFCGSAEEVCQGLKCISSATISFGMFKLVLCPNALMLSNARWIVRKMKKFKVFVVIEPEPKMITSVENVKKIRENWWNHFLVLNATYNVIFVTLFNEYLKHNNDNTPQKGKNDVVHIPPSSPIKCSPFFCVYV